jgi:Tfp pilus assembly major pilin PilA
MSKTQKGFALIEGLLILVIVMILSATGWYVYQSQSKATDNLNNAGIVNNPTVLHPKKIGTNPTGISKANSIKCTYIDSSTDSRVISDVNFLNSTPEIKSLESGPTATYNLEIGSVCTLDNKNTLASFSHWRTSSTDIKYGLLA